MSKILSLAPENTRAFDMEIAHALEDINAAVIVQQLHYWMSKEGVGTTINGVKYVYNTFNDWVKQFPWLSVWQFRKAMKLLRDLEIVKVIRYKSKQWNQTNYYTLNSDRLYQIINPKNARSIETVELCVTTDREVSSQQIEVRDTALSSIDTKKTNQRKTAENKKPNLNKLTQNSNSIAAALPTNALNPKENGERVKTPQVKLNSLQAQNEPKSNNIPKAIEEESKHGECSINKAKEVTEINAQWKSLVEELDSVGVPINKTLVNLMKIYSEEEVRNAIALIKTRKEDKHIPNLAGYFVAALKGGWGCQNLTSQKNLVNEAIDSATVFRLWYELAKELGYCSSQEIRDGEQWVLISGNWEKWHCAIARGYSLEYLKEVMKRNKNN